MLTAKDLILCHGQTQTILLPYDLFLLRVFGRNSRGITTVLGFFFLSFDQGPCNSCGEKLSAFFVLRPIGAATKSPCRSRMALK